MLKHISQIENYHMERSIEHIRDSKGELYSKEYIKSFTINDITRNDYSYNYSSFLSLSFHPKYKIFFLKSNLYNRPL